MGRVLPARRHGRARRGAGRRCSGGSAASCGSRRRCGASRSTARGRGRTHRIACATDAGARDRSTPWSRTPTSITPTRSSTRAAAAAPTRAQARDAWTGRCRCSCSISARTSLPGHRAPHRAVRPALSRAAARDLSRPEAARRLQPVSARARRHRSVAGARRAARRSTCWRPCRTSATRRSTGRRDGRPYADRILASLERCCPICARDIVTRRSSRRSTSASQLAAFQGSAFCVAPTLGQSAWFRPHNRDPRIPGCTSSARARTRARACPASSTRPRRPRARVNDLGREAAGAGGRRRVRRCDPEVRAVIDRRGVAARRDAGAPSRRASRSRASCCRRVRDDAAVIYAWCRRADDAIDLARPAERREALARLRRRARRRVRGPRRADPALAAFRRSSGAASRARIRASCSPAWRWTSTATALRDRRRAARLLLPRRRDGRADDVPRARRRANRARCATRRTWASRCSSPTSAATSPRTGRTVASTCRACWAARRQGRRSDSQVAARDRARPAGARRELYRRGDAGWPRCGSAAPSRSAPRG